MLIRSRMTVRPNRPRARGVVSLCAQGHGGQEHGRRCRRRFAATIDGCAYDAGVLKTPVNPELLPLTFTVISQKTYIVFGCRPVRVSDTGTMPLPEPMVSGGVAVKNDAAGEPHWKYAVVSNPFGTPNPLRVTLFLVRFEKPVWVPYGVSERKFGTFTDENLLTPSTACVRVRFGVDQIP
jgi:hypothetical protein